MKKEHIGNQTQEIPDSIETTYYELKEEEIKFSGLAEKLGLEYSVTKTDDTNIYSSINQIKSNMQRISEQVQRLDDPSKLDKVAGVLQELDSLTQEITPEQCYASNMEHFNTIMQMELGILNGYENDLLKYLQSDKEYMQLDKEAILASLKGESVSLTKYIERALEIFKRDFGVLPNNLSEMKQILKERDNSRVQQTNISENNTKIISLDDYRKDKQQPAKENTQELVSEEIGIKQKIARFLANKPLLRKIPFIDKFVATEQRLFPEVTEKEESEGKTEHSKFVDEISKNGQYRNLFLGQPVKSRVMETAKQKYGEPHSMADKNKIEQMKKKMDEKSMDDDL